MSLRPEFALGHSEFNDFLFALVGEEKSGTELTVLSALTRLGLDPWGEAARLSKLTKMAATSALAAMIANLPEGNWRASDSQSIALRLVDLLPRHVSAPPNPARGKTTAVKNPTSPAQKWVLWIGLSMIVFTALTHLLGE